MRTFTVAFIGGVVGTVFASVIVLAWTDPTSAPPSGNVAAPINVGTTDQIKSAGLGLDALAVFGNAILSGPSVTYLNFGTLPGESGYGIRDNNGTMEFKDSGASWSSLTSVIQSFFSSGNSVSQIKFEDGTTQTTAGGGTSSGTVGGGCVGGGSTGGWGNAACTAASSCSSQELAGSCPSGYTARPIGSGSVSCAGGTNISSGQNCGCGSRYVGFPAGTAYNPSYYPIPMLCIKD